MDESERNAAVEEHLKALDAELERLRRLEAALDRRIAHQAASAEATEEASRSISTSMPSPKNDT